MKISIVSYGIIKSVLPVDHWECEKPYVLGKVVEEISKAYPDLSKYKFVSAVNDELADNRKQLKPGDQIVFIPPFAGG